MKILKNFSKSFRIVIFIIQYLLNIHDQLEKVIQNRL